MNMNCYNDPYPHKCCEGPPGQLTVMIRKQDDGEVQELAYEKLIIATGASHVLPPIEGIDQEGIFTVRTPEDAIRIRSFVSDGGVKRAVVVGGGIIGLEMAENCFFHR